jgi:catechol 2,3-dioxygenase-like lactoylglutathione lyase family enzyme
VEPRVLERALAFYRDGLGLDSPAVTGTEFPGDEDTPAGAVVMFRLQGGLILALYPREELAKDANIPVGSPTTGEFSIGHAVATKEEVDALLKQAEVAGATLTEDPHNRPGVSTQATSVTPTGTCGRSCGIRNSTSRARRPLGGRCH